MEFDFDKFTNQHFNPREKDVPVPDLKPWFKGKAEKDEKGEDKPPVWRVRMLTGPDLARASEAQQQNRDRNAIAQGLLSGSEDKITEAVRELIGTGATVPDDTAKRIEMLVLGSVQPVCSHQMAVKIANTFPVVFTQLTNEIMKLTGLGSEPGKPKRSSAVKKSETPSTSAT